MTDKDREQMCQQAIAEGGKGDLVMKFRAMCLQRGVAGIMSIGRMFRIIDDDGSRRLDYEEFKKGIQERTRMKDDEVKQLFGLFDKDQSGFVEYNEFLHAVRPPMSALRIKLIDMAFNKMDKDGSGVITEADMEGVYDVREHPKFKNGEWTRSQVIKNFLKTFNTDGDVECIVTYDDFKNYYSGVSLSIDDDAYFNLMMRQCWNL